MHEEKPNGSFSSSAGESLVTQLLGGLGPEVKAGLT